MKHVEQEPYAFQAESRHAHQSLDLELELCIMCGADAVTCAADAQLSGHEPVCPPAALCC